MPPELVTQYNGIVHRPAVVGRPLMQVAAADAHVGNFQQHIVGTYGRLVYFPKLDRPLFRSIVYDCSMFHINSKFKVQGLKLASGRLRLKAESSKLAVSKLYNLCFTL